MKPVARNALVMTLVTVSLLLGACRASASGPATIVFEEMRFVPNRIDAVAGEPVRVTLTNKGLQRHDLNFPSLHMPGLEGVEAILEPGETRTITLTFDEPGTHTFQCSLPGHAVAGMTGAVFVRP
ncbi:MAG: hypothetical protein FIA92_02675 [Chloroflexi bacterium]|nr:hypothetical protein [Chloroflexota bacterium]